MMAQLSSTLCPALFKDGGAAAAMLYARPHSMALRLELLLLRRQQPAEGRGRPSPPRHAVQPANQRAALGRLARSSGRVMKLNQHRDNSSQVAGTLIYY